MLTEWSNASDDAKVASLVARQVESMVAVARGGGILSGAEWEHGPYTSMLDEAIQAALDELHDLRVHNHVDHEVELLCGNIVTCLGSLKLVHHTNAPRILRGDGTLDVFALSDVAIGKHISSSRLVPVSFLWDNLKLLDSVYGQGSDVAPRPVVITDPCVLKVIQSAKGNINAPISTPSAVDIARASSLTFVDVHDGRKSADIYIVGISEPSLLHVGIGVQSYKTMTKVQKSFPTATALSTFVSSVTGVPKDRYLYAFKVLGRDFKLGNRDHGLWHGLREHHAMSPNVPSPVVAGLHDFDNAYIFSWVVAVVEANLAGVPLEGLGKWHMGAYEWMMVERLAVAGGGLYGGSLGSDIVARCRAAWHPKGLLRV
jgi:hypothetical protein